VCGNALTVDVAHASLSRHFFKEIYMYIGGGILGTILVVALIIFVLRRA
jgi:nitrate reductase gamma subunit